MNQSNPEYPVYAKLSRQKLMQLEGDYFDWELEEELNVDYNLENREHDFECSFIEGEGCPLIGTEDCDFECPYRDKSIGDLAK